MPPSTNEGLLPLLLRFAGYDLIFLITLKRQIEVYALKYFF